MRKLAYSWVGVVIWSVMCFYYIKNAHMKLSMHDLFLMVPQWCEMTDLIGSGCIELSPEDTLAYCATTVILLVLCWYTIEQDHVTITNIEASRLDNKVDCDVAEEEISKDVVWESVKCLMDQVDLEYNHCSATIASNNESPGKVVGGEAEWASGETNSEDDDVDATREITGAHLRKSLREVEDSQIIKLHQQPLNADYLAIY